MPAIGNLIPLSLQHVVAAVVGIITPSIIVANTCGLTTDERTMLVQAALIMSGLVTLLQSHPLFGKLGSGLPVIMGSAFAYVPTLASIGAQFGIGAILGAELIGGATVTVFGSIAMTGIRMLTQGGLGPRKSAIAGLSLALGMGVAMTEGALTGEGMPLWVGELFGNSAIVITTLCAIVLNLILPKHPEDNVAVQAAEEASEGLEEAEAVICDAPAKGQEPDTALFEEAKDREES